MTDINKYRFKGRNLTELFQSSKTYTNYIQLYTELTVLKLFILKLIFQIKLCQS